LTNTTYLAGLAVTAHNNGLLNTTVFSGFSIATTGSGTGTGTGTSTGTGTGTGTSTGTGTGTGTSTGTGTGTGTSTGTGTGTGTSTGTGTGTGTSTGTGTGTGTSTGTGTGTSTYTDADIGSPGVTGSAVVGTGTIQVSGGGSDIWNASDQFNYDYQTNTTDVTIIAHVDSMTNTDVWAKTGLMFRNSATAGAAFVGVYQNPSTAVELQWRDTDNNQANYNSQLSPTGSANWLKLVKSGTTFTAYYATTVGTPSAANWVLIGTHTTTFTHSTYLGGMAVTAHNNGLLNTSVFSGLSQQ
jgi:hypothetical protein